jgi:hypothetical protein
MDDIDLWPSGSKVVTGTVGASVVNHDDFEWLQSLGGNGTKYAVEPASPVPVWDHNAG